MSVRSLPFPWRDSVFDACVGYPKVEGAREGEEMRFSRTDHSPAIDMASRKCFFSLASALARRYPCAGKIWHKSLLPVVDEDPDGEKLGKEYVDGGPATRHEGV